MIKLHKIILTLTVLVVIVSNILVEAQVPAPTTSPKLPIIPTPKTPLPPPPPPPPAKTTDIPPPPPPPPAKTTDIPPPAKTTDIPPPAKTTDIPPPAKTTEPPPPEIPSSPPSTVAPPPKQSEPLSPPPSFTSAPASPSQIPPPQLCNTSIDCNNTNFCDQGKCQPRSLLGGRCVNKDGCLSQLICSKGVCQFRDNEPTKSHNYDIKKAAITGGIIVGIFVIGGFIFIVYRCIKKRKERKGRELTSSVYSTDGTADFDPIYPFSERTNSFSSSKPTPPSLVPATNHYDPLPPTGNGSRQGYYNYYNNEYKGGYMRQNENEVTKRTMNLLQQTRGNVMIAPHAPHAAPHMPIPQHPQHPQYPQHPQHPQHVPHVPHPPHPPPHLQQNYKWNYGVPGVQPAPPAQQQLMMDQGGLFPVPSVTRQYGGSKLNNMNNDVKKKNSNNKKINNNSFNSSNSSNSNEVNSGDKQKKTQNLRDLLDSNSVDSMPSSGSENNYVESIYDTYARDFRPKTLEVKLSQETNEKKYDSTIERNTSKDSKSVTRRSRSRTFGHVDPRIKSSTTVQEQKNGSKGLNGINEYE